MPSLSVSFNNTVRANVRSQMETILTGELKTGKEVVRESFERAETRKEGRHEALIASFVEQQGKGIRIDYVV